MNLNINDFLSSVLNFDDLTKAKKKRSKLIFSFTLVWLIQTLISVVACIILYKSNAVLLGHLFILISILFIFYFIFKKKEMISIVLFVASSFLIILMFTTFLAPGKYVEYFFLFTAPLIMIFTSNKVFVFSGFIFSYLAFVLPNKIYNIYPNETFQDSFFSFILFTVVLFLVYYYKSINAKNEKLLEIKTKELQDLNQFQSQFFINISHEIKTPLTLLKGQVDHLSESEAPHKIKINRQVNNIKKIVDDVIDLSKMSNNSFTLHKEVIDLKKLVHKIHSSFDSLFAQKNITFSFINSGDEFYILADALYLERAINNLILNAYKYTDKKGEVIIKLIKKDSRIILSISDTGIGIEKNNYDKIFNRFYQVNNDLNKTGGSGVGLAFTKEIVDMLDGKIEVKSKLEEGTNFTIIFPFANDYQNQEKIDDASDNSIADLSALQTQVNQNKTILIVDDSYEMRAYLRDLLGGYNCFEAENGEEALAILKTKKIDFVLTDYMMPKMNGLEFVTNIKKQNILVPTLMLTARSDYNSKLEVLSLGVDDYLSKPFEKDELLIRIHNILNNYSNKRSFLSEQRITNTELKENVQWVTKLKKYIIKNCDNPKLNQTDIAEHFNISKSTFYRKVKMETGLTPNEFINEVKLLEARKIVENQRDISLKELSLKVGFLHASYFTTQYKKRFGTHPIKS